MQLKTLHGEKCDMEVVYGIFIAMREMNFNENVQFIPIILHGWETSFALENGFIRPTTFTLLFATG